MSGTDLVPVTGDLAQAEALQIAAAITELGRQGDAERLQEVADEVDARVSYFRHQKLTDAIQRGVRLRLLAEAEMGEILIRGEWPDGLDITEHTIVIYKAIAIGRRRGALEAAINDLTQGETASSSVYTRLCRAGVLWVPHGALRDAIKQSGLRQAEIARRAGVSRHHVASLAGTRPLNVGWLSAAAVAALVGCQSTTLPRARNKPSRKRRHTWLRRQQKLTGGKWDKAYSQFRLAVDAFAAVAGEGGQWDDAYAHWYALEETIGRQLRLARNTDPNRVREEQAA